MPGSTSHGRKVDSMGSEERFEPSPETMEAAFSRANGLEEIEDKERRAIADAAPVIAAEAFEAGRQAERDDMHPATVESERRLGFLEEHMPRLGEDEEEDREAFRAALEEIQFLITAARSASPTKGGESE